MTQETLPAIPKGYEDWSLKLQTAATSYRESLWDIGDLLNEGENRFGELFAQAASDTKLAPSTLQNAKWVCAAIPKDTRHSDLSFSLHMEVAKLKPKYQKIVLSLAAKQEWPSKEVRKRVKAVEAGEDEALLPDWNPSSQRGTSPPESGDESPPPTPDSSSDIPDHEKTEEQLKPKVSPRPNLDSRAQYIAFHTAELRGLCVNTAPSMIVDDLEGNALKQFFMDAEDVGDFLNGVGNHKP